MSKKCFTFVNAKENSEKCPLLEGEHNNDGHKRQNQTDYGKSAHDPASLCRLPSAVASHAEQYFQW
jgi:hypothetical protein